MTRRAALLALALLGGPSIVHAEATITLRTEGGGFTDDTPASPVGGNAGTTLGAQRRIAVQYTADLWAKHLDSPIPIRLRALFSYFGCEGGSAIIASASATEHRSLPGGGGVLYPAALADRLAGRDLNPESPDIDMRINADLDGPCSELGSFYYGLDGEVFIGQVDLVQTTLHELAHGLGFASLIDPSSGASTVEEGSSSYDQHVFDRDLDKAWSEMSPAERRASALAEGRVVWSGNAVAALAPAFLERRPTGGSWGTDRDGGVLLYTPRRLALGSSVSHFDSSATPDLLMEPFASLEPTHGLDLTVAALRDLGWPGACGDGLVDPDESCDDGSANDDGGSCRSDCRPATRPADEPTVATYDATVHVSLDAGAVRRTDASSFLARDEGAEGCDLRRQSGQGALGVTGLLWLAGYLAAVRLKARPARG